MSFRCWVDEQHDLVRVEVSGEVDVEASLGALRELRTDPRFRPTLPIVADTRALASPGEPEQVRECVASLSALPVDQRPSCIAVVVDRAVSYGMVRMLSAMIAPIGLAVHAFSDVDDATRWCQGLSS